MIAQIRVLTERISFFFYLSKNTRAHDFFISNFYPNIASIMRKTIQAYTFIDLF